ncbi:hypothetical protein BHM03_00051520 [Ensete ventricosum]|nr:hypothetical protein BHM03_00051520 [Ensete ventricosum]
MGAGEVTDGAAMQVLVKPPTRVAKRTIARVVVWVPVKSSTRVRSPMGCQGCDHTSRARVPMKSLMGYQGHGHTGRAMEVGEVVDGG